MVERKYGLSKEELREAVEAESREFERALRWLEEHLPKGFLEEVEAGVRVLVARALMSFGVQGRFAEVHVKQMALVLCMDGPDADLRILGNFDQFAIRYYRAFVSNEPPPGEKVGCLRVAVLCFRDAPKEEKLEAGRKEELRGLIGKKVGDGEFEGLLAGLTPRFVRSLTNERLKMALDVFFRARERDDCQFELRRNKEAPSLQLVLAWKNVPKAGFLFRLTQIIYSHGLALQKVVATYIDPYSTESVLILSMGLHGLKGGAAWDEADLDDFLREMCLLKYFSTDDVVRETFVKAGLLSGNEAHLIRTIGAFVHQVLVHADPNLYSHDHVMEGLCRHPELTVKLAKAFREKFEPGKADHEKYERTRDEFAQLVDRLDTGQAVNDLRRKNVLKQGIQFVEFGLKTNYYCPNKTGFSFRLDPRYLEHVPYERKEKFPEVPFGIFFVRGMHFIGFNIRFKDLARGGVRTVTPERWEVYAYERNNIFSEGYNLAYTQQKKNKDIPEGGAKTAILMQPYDAFAKEEEIYRNEMESDGVKGAIVEEKLKIYRRDHKLAYLYATQRAFIESFMTLINCDPKGKLKADHVVDYWKRPEYIYLGPDENMLNDMIVWIAKYSVACGYEPGRSFMSSKPGAGINHKEYGVTSYGVNVYLHQVLLYLGIDPDKDPFTIKVSGGPDGDVAGNELHILATKYPKTAKLLALTDVSGTIHDPIGLEWKEVDALFKAGKSIRFYPPDKLHDGGFLLDLQTKREESAYAQQTLCWRKKGNKAVQEWVSGSEMNHLFRSNVHQTVTDVFVPGGGRPRTLNESNYETYLDATGKPTSKAIVEGANLYLTPMARRALEKLGVLVIKDSSCNKGGVICSSFEVLASLCLSEEEFIKEKAEYVKEVLEIIRKAALHEANLLLETHKNIGTYLTDLSERVSERINLYKYQLLDYLEGVRLSSDRQDPLIRCLLLYCPPLLRKRYPERILKMPDIHKKAIIAVFLASHLVYTRGLDWAPSIADVLSSVASDPKILND